MRKQSKKVENRPVSLVVIEKGMEKNFPKMPSNSKFVDWEMMLYLFEEYKPLIQKSYYSESIFAHQEGKGFSEKEIKKLPEFSERIYTNQKVLVLKTYTSIISVGKVYQVIINIDKEFPKGEECVVGDNGELVTLLCFKYKIQD